MNPSRARVICADMSSSPSAASNRSRLCGQHRVAVVEQVRVQKWTELGCVLRQNPGASNHRLGLPAGQQAPAEAGVGGRSETFGEVARLTSHRRSPLRKRP